MKINITQFFTLELEEANKILRIAYLKGYLKSCEVVQNGCDIFRYIPSTKLIEFRIVDPLIWVTLRLDQVIDCQIDLLEREKHHEKKAKKCLDLK